MPSHLAKLALDQLSGARAQLSGARVLIGFDGFVDTIIHVVAQRESASKYTRMATISEFGRRVSAAAGVSANFEFVTQRVKLGGNGPIMANALGSYGAPVTYVGNLGSPSIHPVFSDLAERARVISIAEPAYTDAIEFEDGKLMCGKHESLQQVNWATLLKHLPEEEIVALFEESTLIAMVNWTMLPHMSALWQKIRTRVAPRLTPKPPARPGEAGEKGRWLFFDLADPAKRTREDIASALDAILKFQKYFRVILGLNFEEGRQIGEVLGIAPPESTPEQVSAHAGKILDALGIDTVVIHPHPLCRRRRFGWLRGRGRPLRGQTEDHHRSGRSFQCRVLHGPDARGRSGGELTTWRGDFRILRAPCQESGAQRTQEVP
jgi:hypothetical protein